MAPLMTGLRRSELRWNKFMPKYMFNNTYYLRRTKMVVYQLCSILLALSSELANAAAKRYEDRRHNIIQQNSGLSVHVRDIVTVRIVEKAVGGVVGVVFGTAFLFDLLWPERRESKVMSWIWKLSALIGSMAQLAAAIYATFVVVTGGVEILGPNREVVEEAWSWKEYGESPLAIVSVVMAWLSLVIVVYCTVVMWLSYAMSSKFGPFANCRRDGMQEASGEIDMS